MKKIVTVLVVTRSYLFIYVFIFLKIVNLHILLRNLSFIYGPGLCSVNFFTGHVGSWTRVQEWTCVQIWLCPVIKFTGQKPCPSFIMLDRRKCLINSSSYSLFPDQCTPLSLLLIKFVMKFIIHA